MLQAGVEGEQGGFGLGGEGFVAVWQVAAVEDGKVDAVWDVVGEVLVGGVYELDLLVGVVLFEALAGGFEGGALDVEGVNFSCWTNDLGEFEGVVAVACGGVDGGAACGQKTWPESVGEGEDVVELALGHGVWFFGGFRWPWVVGLCGSSGYLKCGKKVVVVLRAIGGGWV